MVLLPEVFYHYTPQRTKSGHVSFYKKRTFKPLRNRLLTLLKIVLLIILTKFIEKFGKDLFITEKGKLFERIGRKASGGQRAGTKIHETNSKTFKKIPQGKLFPKVFNPYQKWRALG